MKGQSVYTITDLGNATANGINNRGQVVGGAYTDGFPHAFLYSGGRMLDLGTLAGTTPRIPLPASGISSAMGINETVQIVGEATTTGNSAIHAFFYSGGHMLDLGTLGGGGSSAVGINNRGEIVGEATTTSNAIHAFLYRGGRMLDLGILGGSDSGAQGINTRGQIVGAALITDNSAFHAFLYSCPKTNDPKWLRGRSLYSMVTKS